MLTTSGLVALAGFVDGLWPVLIISGAGLAIWSLALPTAEALALTGVRRFGLDYGRMRLYGSATFMIANLTSGGFRKGFAANRPGFL